VLTQETQIKEEAPSFCKLAYYQRACTSLTLAFFLTSSTVSVSVLSPTSSAAAAARAAHAPRNTPSAFTSDALAIAAILRYLASSCCAASSSDLASAKFSPSYVRDVSSARRARPCLIGAASSFSTTRTNASDATEQSFPLLLVPNLTGQLATAINHICVFPGMVR
jgi:hypothetical protein